MKLRCVGFLFSMAMLGAMANVASADYIGHIGLEYTTSYDSEYNTYDLAPELQSMGNGATRSVFTLGPSQFLLVHEFNVRLSVSGLAADEDMTSMQFDKVFTGSVVPDDAGLMGAGYGYVAINPSIDPPVMGDPTKSNAPSAPAFFINMANSVAVAIDMQAGATETGNGNGTYGDYFAHYQMGEGAGTVIGQMYLISGVEGGEFAFSFLPNPGYFQIIGGNADGMGTSAGISMPAYSAQSDSVRFNIIPEPSSLILLAGGLIGLLAYAWRRRR